MGQARLLVLGGLGLLCACNTGRETPDAGSNDAGIGAPQLSVILTAQPFVPGSIGIDFTGNFVCAERDHAALHTVDHDSLGPVATDTLSDGGAWQLLGARTGRAGAGYLATRTGQLYAVDLDRGGGALLADVGEPVLAFAARRDAVGVAWSGEDGTVHLLGPDGGEERAISFDGGVPTDLASSPDGHLYAALALDGGCTRVDAVGTSGAATSTELAGSSSGCALALAQDNTVLWVARAIGSQAELSWWSVPGLSKQGALAFDGMVPTRVVAAADGRKVAILGAFPGHSAVVVRTADLVPDSGITGSPVRFLDPSQLPEAADAVFDDNDALYVADPAGQSVDLVR